MADRIVVPFRGGGAGVAELSWGQRELWGTMQEKHTWLPIGMVLPLPPGTTAEDVAAELRFLMSHYPTLRTRLRLDPAGTKQVVAGSGEVVLEVVDVAPDADPAEVAERVRQRYWDTDYDFASEWPVRMAVIRHRGHATHRVWVMCHLVTDGTGAAIMVAELTDRDASGSAAAMPPLAQARWQQSTAGRRQCARVLRHWERLLREIPARRFPDRADRVGPRYWNGSFSSAAMHLAVGAIAIRTGVASSAVLLALFAVALARVTGISPVVTRVVVSNRFRPGLATTVSPIVHNGLCRIDVAGRTVDEVVALARRQAMTAYKHAYYDPPQLYDLVTRVSRERGEDIDIGCFFNDRRLRHAGPAGPASTPAQIEAARRLTSFGWDERQDDKPYDALFLNIDDAPGTVAGSVFIDAWQLPPADAEACVREMEAVAVAAASHPAVPAGAPAATCSGGCGTL